MLARLEALDGVVSAAVDHRGELLRLGVRDEGVLDRVRHALRDLGYGASAIDASEQTNERWYASANVRELSREEARIVADRVVPPFAVAYPLTDSEATRLTSVVSTALFECFTAHTLGSGPPADSLRRLCSQAVAEAAKVLVGTDAADDLAARIDADLGGSATGR